MNRLVFVTGAARSGKSQHAEALAASLAGEVPVLYVATADVGDGEMRQRVEEHRRRRPQDWRTLEARRDVAERLRESGTVDLVLLDCLSLLVSNVLLDIVEELGEGADAELKASETVQAEVEALIHWHGEFGGNFLFVSNEVGWGVVPPHRLGRVYRDLLGRANQQVAAASTDAFLMVAGIPVTLKGSGLSAGS